MALDIFEEDIKQSRIKGHKWMAGTYLFMSFSYFIGTFFIDGIGKKSCIFFLCLLFFVLSILSFKKIYKS